MNLNRLYTVRLYRSILNYTEQKEISGKLKLQYIFFLKQIFINK